MPETKTTNEDTKYVIKFEDNKPVSIYIGDKKYAVVVEDTKTTKEPPEIIYLFDMGEGFVWCDDPEPDYDKRDVWEYKRIRKSHDAEN